MNRSLLLRIASVLSFLFALGHSPGGMKSWSPMADNDVFRAMKSVAFDLNGTSRTYLYFYLGFGWTIAVFLFLQAIVLWQLAALAKKPGAEVGPVIGAFLVASLLLAILSWKFILLIPTLFAAVIAVVLGLAAKRPG